MNFGKAALMRLHEAIGACEKGQKITANCLPPGSYLHYNDEGELWVTLDDEGNGHKFYIKPYYHNFEWHLKQEGWLVMTEAICDICKAPEVVTNLDGDNLCQKCANNWVKGERPEPHNCSYSSSTLIGGPASCATFHCNVCGEEWEKDVS